MNKRKVFYMALKYLITIICVLIIALPISILIYGSLKGNGIQNYIDILTKYHIEIYFKNSAIVEHNSGVYNCSAGSSGRLRPFKAGVSV